ncbi:MAG: hypothetical protein ACRYGF_06145 [Janthinobacterium lividum]
MKHVIALALFAALPAAALAPADVDLSGTWTVAGDVQGVAVEETCTLVQQDVVLTGSCDTSSGKYDVKGKIDGKTATFSHGGKYQGSDFVMTFTGKIGADGAMTGTMDVDPFNVTGSFSAKKGAAPAKPAA